MRGVQEAEKASGLFHHRVLCESSLEWEEKTKKRVSTEEEEAGFVLSHTV